VRKDVVTRKGVVAAKDLRGAFELGGRD